MSSQGGLYGLAATTDKRSREPTLCCTSLLYGTPGTVRRDCHRASDLGALGGTRTPNLLIRSQMLYPLSYERRCAAQSTAHCANSVLSRADL